MLPQSLFELETIKHLYNLQEEKMAKEQNGLKSCGSLWKGSCKTGTMLSGNISLGILGEVNVLIFPNGKKGKATDPDYFFSVKAAEQNGLKSVGSLWKGTCKNGTMLSGFISVGALGDINVLIFPNTKKGKSADPDYFVSVKTDAKEPEVPMPPANDDL